MSNVFVSEEWLTAQGCPPLVPTNKVGDTLKLRYGDLKVVEMLPYPLCQYVCEIVVDGKTLKTTVDWEKYP